MVWRKLPNAILKQRQSIGQYKTLLRNQIRSFSSTNNNNGENKDIETPQDESKTTTTKPSTTQMKSKSTKDSIKNAMSQQKMQMMNEYLEKKPTEKKSSSVDIKEEVDVVEEFVEQVFYNKDTKATTTSNKSTNYIKTQQDEELIKTLLDNYSKSDRLKTRQYIKREQVTEFGLLDSDYNSEYPPYVNRVTGSIVTFDKVMNTYKYQDNAFTREKQFSKQQILYNYLASDEMVILQEYFDSSPIEIKNKIISNDGLFKFAVERIQYHQALIKESLRNSVTPGLSVTEERDLLAKMLAESSLVPREVVAEIATPFIEKNVDTVNPEDKEFGLFDNASYYKAMVQEELESRQDQNPLEFKEENVPITPLYDQYIASEQILSSSNVDPVPSKLNFGDISRDQILRDQLRQYYFELSQRELNLVQGASSSTTTTSTANKKVYKPIPEGFEKYDGPIQSVQARDAPIYTFDPEFMKDFVHYKALALPHENLRVQEYLDDANNEVNYDIKQDSRIEQEEAKKYIDDHFNYDEQEDFIYRQTLSDNNINNNTNNNKKSTTHQSTTQQSSTSAFAGSAFASQSQQKSQQQSSSQQQSQNEQEQQEESEEKLEGEEESKEEEEDGAILQEPIQAIEELYDMDELDETNQDADLFLDSDESYSEFDDDEDNENDEDDEDVSEFNDDFKKMDKQKDGDQLEAADEEDSDVESVLETFVDPDVDIVPDEENVDMLDSKDPLYNEKLKALGVSGPTEQIERGYLRKGDIEFLQDMELITDSLFLTMDSDDEDNKTSDDLQDDAITFGGVEHDDDFQLGDETIDFNKDYEITPYEQSIAAIDSKFAIDRSAMTKQQVIQSLIDEYAIVDIDENERILLKELEKELSPIQYSRLLEELKKVESNPNYEIENVDQYSAAVNKINNKFIQEDQDIENTPEYREYTRLLELKEQIQDDDEDDDDDQFTQDDEDYTMADGESLSEDYRKANDILTFDGEEIQQEEDDELTVDDGQVLGGADDIDDFIGGDEDDEDDDEDYLDQKLGFTGRSDGFNITHPNGIQQLENIYEEMELLDIMQGTYEEDLDLLRAEADMYARRTGKKMKHLAKRREFAQAMKVKQMEALKLNPPTKPVYSIQQRPIGHNIYTNVLAPPNSYLRLNTPTKTQVPVVNQDRNKQIIQESYRALSSNPFYGVKEANFAVKKINKELLASEGHKKFRKHQLNNTKPVPSPMLSKPAMLVHPDKLTEFNSFYREN